MEGRKGQRAPYELNMDPDEALRLVKHGASLLLLEVPPGTSFGIDCQMFVVGPNFKGMKMIPPGPHFVYYSASSRSGNECAPVIGFFIFTASSEVIVRQWDPREERLVKLADNNETQILETLLEQKYGGCEDLLLGELQFAFIAFLMGQSLEAFGQWKAIVSLVLSCEDAPLHTRTPFFSKVLEVVYFQLKQGFQTKPNIQEKESMAFLDDSWLSNDCFLQLLFKDFFSLIRDVQPIDGELLYQAKRLKKVLETTLGWRFNKDVNHGKENDEFAPVVVTEEVLSNEEMETNDLPLLE